MERLHEAASRRLEELKISKQTQVKLNKAKKPRRPVVDVIYEKEEDESEMASNSLIAEEN